ncbi:hypothetical protein BC835DRAFT_1412939 [Cytidiella melzeri]|nr:hypothetical protein BC835DRAFT_1412939 [Cytidiella melzeri]
MPRFFPSFGHRSRETRDPRQDHYDRYDQYGHSERRVSPSAWSRMAPNTKSRETLDKWDEEVLDRPDSYAGIGAHQSRTGGPSYSAHDNQLRRPTVHDESDRLSESTIAGSYDEHYAHDNAIPIVQRESSLTRLQEAFADHGASTRPVTEVNLPQQMTGQSRYPSADMLQQSVPVPPVGQIHGSAELRNAYAEQHQPMLVPNMTASSHRADIVGSRSRRAHEKRPEYRQGDEPERPRYRSDQRNEYRPRPRRNSSASSRSSGDDDRQEYPPCVVVVERGRHGKKDTYYIIPGGAPVIFEDDKGNELTRVGDFTGRYRPRPQRPVIIEDSRGQEIGRLGFDDESSLDYPYRNHSSSHEDLQDRSKGYDYGRKYSSHRDRDHADSSRSHRSYDNSSRHSSKHASREEYRHEPPRGRPPPSTSNANVVYVPYTSSSRSSGSVRTPSPRSGKSSRREYEPSRSSHRSHSSNVIHLDQFDRQTSGSASSRSSGRRSHGSERRH